MTTAAGASLEVVNAGLVYLGESPLISESDDVPAADVVRAQWALVRRAELSAHPWVFATRRVELGASGTAPTFGWARAFALPADCLRLLELPELGWYWYRQGNGEPFQAATSPLYELEEGHILADAAAPLRCRYVFDAADWSKWPPLFMEMLGFRWAMILADLVTQSTTRRQEAAVEYDRAIKRAKRNNAIQRPPRQLQGVSPWLAARGG